MNSDKTSEAVMWHAAGLKPLVEGGASDAESGRGFIQCIPANRQDLAVRGRCLRFNVLHILKGQRRARRACVLSRRITSIRTSRYRSI